MLGSISHTDISKSLHPKNRERYKRVKWLSFLMITLTCADFMIFTGCTSESESVLRFVFSQPQWDQYDFNVNGTAPNSVSPLINEKLVSEVVAVSESLGIKDVQLPIYNDKLPADGVFYHKSFQETFSDEREYTMRFNAYVSSQTPKKIYSAWITVLLPKLSESGQQTLLELIFSATADKKEIEKKILDNW